MPVDVAVEEPRSRVIGEESDGHEIRFAGADAHDIADDRINKVVGIASGAPDHMEGMLLNRHVSMRADHRSRCMIDLRRASGWDAKHCQRRKYSSKI